MYVFLLFTLDPRDGIISCAVRLARFLFLLLLFFFSLHATVIVIVNRHC